MSADLPTLLTHGIAFGLIAWAANLAARRIWRLWTIRRAVRRIRRS